MSDRPSLSESCAIVGLGETGFLRGDPVAAPDLWFDPDLPSETEGDAQ